MSYETYAHVRDIVTARQLPPKRFKGIAREVVPYMIEPGRNSLPASEVSRDGNRVTVHLERLDETSRTKLRQLLDDQV